MAKSGKTPLLQALVKRHRLNTVSLHMPGHKKGKGINPRFARLMETIPFSLDMTEVPGLDDLHNPTGPIGEAQMRAARLFGADKTFFLVNGTTVGIHAALLAACGSKEEVLLPRDVHKSVVGAFILSGSMPRYLPARLNQEFMVPYPPLVKEVREAFRAYPGIKAVFQVYPSYYGVTGDLESIVAESHRHQVPVIVDEAHAAHFAFSPRLPKSAMECGADVSIQSTHKTLGALTQASMLHLKSDFIHYTDISHQLDILQSTSPSYILMASLDAAVGYLESRGTTLTAKAVSLAVQARERINGISGLKCLDISGAEGVTVCEPMKIFVSVEQLGLTGQQVAHRLLKKYRIQVELSNRIGILCLLSIGNSQKDIAQLISALQEISNERQGARGKGREQVSAIGLDYLPCPHVVKTPREAWFSEKRRVSLHEAVGKISGEIIAPYPPGIPVVCPGEEFTPEIIDVISYFKAADSVFHGPADPDVNFVRIIAD